MYVQFQMLLESTLCKWLAITNYDYKCIGDSIVRLIRFSPIPSFALHNAKPKPELSCTNLGLFDVDHRYILFSQSLYAVLEEKYFFTVLCSWQQLKTLLSHATLKTKSYTNCSCADLSTERANLSSRSLVSLESVRLPASQIKEHSPKCTFFTNQLMSHLLQWKQYVSGRVTPPH